jgi:small-conductance mechanosensitive channel
VDQLVEYLDRLPPFFRDTRVRAALYVLAAVLVSRLAALVIIAVLRGLARRTVRWDERTVALLDRPIFYSVLLLCLTAVTSQLFGDGGMPFWIEGSLKTIGALIWSITVMRLVISLLTIIGEHRTSGWVQQRTLPLFVNMTKLLAFAGATYFVFLAWNIDVSAWLASAGIIGIAIGFAAKDSLANLLAGVFIVTDAPYKIGDYINLDTGERGVVTDIGLRSTRILTRDDVEVTIPNSIMGNAKIINESGGPHKHHRVRVQVSVAYGSDVDELRRVLLDVAAACDLVRPEPEPRVRFRSFGDSGLEFELLGWIDDPQDRGRVIDSLNEAIYKSLAKHRIEIPYPKRDVYVRQLPAMPAPGKGMP